MTNLFVRYYRDGVELYPNHPGNRRFMYFGKPTGKVGNVPCFDSLRALGAQHQGRKVTQDYFGFPVTVCLVDADGKNPQYFGLADAATVAAVNAERAQGLAKA